MLPISLLSLQVLWNYCQPRLNIYKARGRFLCLPLAITLSFSSLHTFPPTQLAPYTDYPLWILLTDRSAKVYKTYSCQFSKQKLLLFCIGNNNLLLMSQYLLFHLIVFSVICIYLKRINPLVFYKQVQDLLV